ncbi:MAG: hypothetical protein HY698_18910 [Deltaproteobacteria bacterium]|nr:hypothetical protein [Deltaproteobacteria bacterium]
MDGARGDGPLWGFLGILMFYQRAGAGQLPVALIGISQLCKHALRMTTNTLSRFFRIVLVSFVSLAPGCITASFVQTDGSFVPHELASGPSVYLDRLPERPYRSVGIIEVKGPAGSFDLGNLLPVVQEKGKEVGCDLIIDRAIYRVSGELPTMGVLVAGVGAGYYGQTTTNTPIVYTESAPPGRREFICAVWQ